VVSLSNHFGFRISANFIRSGEFWISGLSGLGHWILPFDWAQGGESFDFAQDREPVERLVEPFVICDL
jgi:hypothetical protein